MYYCINKNESGELHIKRQLPHRFHAELRNGSRPSALLHASAGSNDGRNDPIPETALGAPGAGGRSGQGGTQGQNCRSADGVQG